MPPRWPLTVTGAIGAVLAAGVALRLAVRLDPATAGVAQLGILRSVPAFLLAGVIGALVLRRRPGHRAGVLLLAASAAFAGLLLAESWAQRALLGRAVPAPGGVAAAWVARWLWVAVFALVAAPLLVLPDGRLPGPRWRVAAGVLAVGATATALAFALEPGPLDPLYPTVVNPVGVAVPPAFGRVGGVLLLLGMVLCAASLVARHRSGDAVLRQQVTWVALGGAAAVVALGVHATVGQSPALNPWTLLAVDAGLLALFAAMGIAVLRHRLFDVDVVISAALVYGGLAVAVTAVYVAVVVGGGRLLGGASLVPSLAATVLVALGFAPARERARRLADRWVYGARGSPYELLAAFGRRVAGAVSTDELLPGVAHAAADGVGAAAAQVRLALRDGTTRSTAWPGLPLPPGEPYRVPVRARGEELGDIAVVPRPGFALTRTQRRLIDDLARQAAPAMANARLTGELAAQADALRASRRRLVAAQDDERRRLERDLHDGAQQELVAVTLALRAVAARAPAALVPSLEQVREQVAGTLGTLRTLARGVFPPLLAEAGLGAAVSAHLARVRLPVRFVDATDGARADAGTEAALYFCCLEALQNATKHAGAAATVTVTLSADERWLRVTVEDDGVGFAAAAAGTGLVHLADRMAAVGGELEVRSVPGAGTAVRARAPRGG